jgi:ankyrin repeat protein
MKTVPALAREEDTVTKTPVHLAALYDKIDVLGVLLEHDPSLGYLVTGDGFPLLSLAGFRGHVGIARELLKHCPDAPSTSVSGWTYLHTAVSYQQTEFVDFVLGLPQSGRLVNMRTKDGDTALHLAVQKCNPKMVAALLLHPGIDVTVLNNNGNPANWALPKHLAKTLNWVRIFFFHHVSPLNQYLFLSIFCAVILFSYHPCSLLESD